MTGNKKLLNHIDDFANEISDSFLANINHALRTPLNGMVGMMDLLTKTGLSDNQLQYAHVIRESTTNLMLQLDNIMTLARIEDEELSVQSSSCRLKDVIHSAVQTLIPLAVKQGVPISLELDENLPEFIDVDEQKLRLVLTNLFSCSLKFAEHGKIVLNVSKIQDEEDENQFCIRFTLANSKALYDALNNAQEKYQDVRAKDLKEFGEITVSLITTQKLLAAIDTHIGFDSMSGQEPPFYFDLIYTEAKAKVPISAYSALQDKHALIVQDDIVEFNVLVQALQLWGVRHHIIDDADKIVSYIDDAHREGRPYDVVFVNGNEITPDILNATKEKISNLVCIVNDQQPQDSVVNTLSVCLRNPVYPEELLAALSSFFGDLQPDYEASLSSEASQLIRDNVGAYEPIKANVMIVEDDFVSRIYAAEILEGFGCSVTMAENGEHALSKLSHSADYDLIFMDCMMPRLDGYNTTRQIREAGYGDIKVIALTANTLEQDKEKCLAAGMNDYVTKPVKEQDLYSVLTQYIKS